MDIQWLSDMGKRALAQISAAVCGEELTRITQLLAKLSGTRLSRARQFFYHCLVQRIAIKDPAGLEADIEDAVSLLRGRVKP